MNDHNAATIAALTAALRQGDEDARLRAAEKLAAPPADPAAVPAFVDLIIEVLGDDSFRVRKAAVKAALGFPHVAHMTDRLVVALGEPDNVGRRNAAVEALVDLGSGAVEPLLTALQSRPEHRKVLLDVLGAIGDSRGAPALREALSDTDPNVRAAAAEGLGNVAAPEVVPALLDVLDGEQDLVVLLAALCGLNQRQVALPLQTLQDFLQKAVLRPATMTALGQSRDLRALPLLLTGLLDRARGAREAAMLGLCQLHETLDQKERAEIERALQEVSELAVRDMLRALLEASPEARRAAALLLGWTGRGEAVRPLVLTLIGGLETGAAVAHTAGRSLAALGLRALATLSDLLPELDRRGKGAIYGFFAQFGGQLLSQEVQTAQAQALLDRARALVRDGLFDRDAVLATEAARAMRSLGGRDLDEEVRSRMDSLLRVPAN